jgi:GDP/UDP-N,N'-diacetylbacillosamine 2-epimerase (hydrolysing)
MGENAANIVVTGAPGLDGLIETAVVPRTMLCQQLDFDASRKIALFVFHPVLTEARDAGTQTRILITSLLEQGLQIVALRPNADAGSSGVNEVLDEFESNYDLRVVTHFPRQVFVSWMVAADVMVGNSSSGIIEAATFGIPVLNVGTRQNLRERNANVMDVGFEKSSFVPALTAALVHGKFEKSNCYGNGQAGVRITELLANFPLTRNLLSKCNSY